MGGTYFNEIPAVADVSVQQLNGLRRRGLLAYDGGQWTLTESGAAYRDALRAEAGDRGD